MDQIDKSAKFIDKLAVKEVSLDKLARWWTKGFNLVRNVETPSIETMSLVSKKTGLEGASISTVTPDLGQTRFVNYSRNNIPGSGLGKELYTQAAGKYKREGVTRLFSDMSGGTSPAAVNTWENHLSKKYKVTKNPDIPVNPVQGETLTEATDWMKNRGVRPGFGIKLNPSRSPLQRNPNRDLEFIS